MIGSCSSRQISLFEYGNFVLHSGIILNNNILWTKFLISLYLGGVFHYRESITVLWTRLLKMNFTNNVSSFANNIIKCVIRQILCY